jgi:hypothetical protein
MGFGNHETHVLQPLLNKDANEATVLGRPTKKTLLEVAEKLVFCSLYGFIPYYSDEEREAAKQLLKINGLSHISNCSPRYRARTLILIEAEKENLARDTAEQLEVCH